MIDIKENKSEFAILLQKKWQSFGDEWGSFLFFLKTFVLSLPLFLK